MSTIWAYIDGFNLYNGALKGTTYTAHELANCSGACHVYGDTTQSTITRSLPGPHHRVTDATFRR